jgi:hypothetical protein
MRFMAFVHGETGAGSYISGRYLVRLYSCGGVIPVTNQQHLYALQLNYQNVTPTFPGPSGGEKAWVPRTALNHNHFPPLLNLLLSRLLCSRGRPF